MDKEHPNHTPMKANKNPAVKHALPPRGLNNARPAPAKLLAEIRSHLCSNCAIASTPDLPTSQYRSPQLLLERPDQPTKRKSPGLALTPFALSACSGDPPPPLHTQPTQARWRTCAAAQLDHLGVPSPRGPRGSPWALWGLPQDLL